MVDSRGAVSFIRGSLGHIDLLDADRAAARLLEDLTPLLRTSGHGRFRPLSANRDAVGLTHVRLQQFIDGLPVVGADGYVHADRDGNVYAINGTFAVDRSASAPGLPAEVATRLALQELGFDAFRVGEHELGYVLDHAGRARLAWGFDVEYTDDVGPQRDRVFADAIDGSVAARHPQHHYARYRTTYSANNGVSLPGTLKRSETQGPTTDSSVNRAHDNAGHFYDYYHHRFGRDSFDNEGAQIRSTVHYSVNYANWFWNGSQMVYGDGNVNLGEPTVLDVVGHELTHAVTEDESALIFNGESGAVSESISDIFAANIEAWVDGAIGPDTWKIGEDCWTAGLPGDAMRYMNNPTLDGQSRDYYPQRYTGASDNGGVHWNSGIPNLAYYLLVQGGTHPRGMTTVVVPGIGMGKAEQIFYRAQTMYLTSNSDMTALRNATMQCAADLYAQSDVAAVALAWDAVGVPGSTSAAGPGEPPATLARILDVSPNPFSRSTRIRLAPGREGDAVLHVYDVNGRAVRRLTPGDAAGERSVTWDGRDESAARVSNGIYFIRLMGAPEADAVRVTLLK